MTVRPRGTIRLKLLKIGALVRISVRRITVAMASARPWFLGRQPRPHKPLMARTEQPWVPKPPELGKTIHQQNSIGRAHTVSNLKLLNKWCDFVLKLSDLILHDANTLEGYPLPYQPSPQGEKLWLKYRNFPASLETQCVEAKHQCASSFLHGLFWPAEWPEPPRLPLHWSPARSSGAAAATSSVRRRQFGQYALKRRLTLYRSSCSTLSTASTKQRRKSVDRCDEVNLRLVR